LDYVKSTKLTVFFKSHFGLCTLEGATEKPMPRLRQTPALLPRALAPGKRGALEGQSLKAALWGCCGSGFDESRGYHLNMTTFVKILDGKKAFNSIASEC